MRLLKQALGLLGALVVLAVIVAFVAPKRARAVAAALVQIVPGTTTHVGQNESQLVSLACGKNPCVTISPEGVTSTSAYAVPSGYTLIVTDYQFTIFGGLQGVLSPDDLFDTSNNNTLAGGWALGDKNGTGYGHEHYATGIRVGSGVMMYDGLAAGGFGAGSVQGYLVPND